MNFNKVLPVLVSGLENLGIRYALIGGFALAMRGVQRSTMDLDFILALDDLEQVDQLLLEHGYKREFRSENVSHYRSLDEGWGRIDLLHAFRAPSLGMLDRAEPMEVSPGVLLPVARVEDLIGLKVQALCNDPGRESGDWSDIRLVLRAAADQDLAMDWELIEEYLSIFRLNNRLAEIKTWYHHEDD